MLRFSTAGWPCSVDQPVGVVGERRDIVRGDAGVAATAIRDLGDRVAHLGRALGAAPCVVASIFSRMSAIEFWFLSLSSSVSRSVSRWMRSISSGALLSRALMPPELAGTTGQPCGPICSIGGRPRSAPASWISLTPVKPTPWICALVPWSTGVCSSTSIRTHTNSGRLGSSEILLHLADRNAGEADVRALVEPADRLARNRCRSIWSPCSRGRRARR